MPLWLELALKACVLLLVVLLFLIRAWVVMMPEDAVMDRDGAYAGWIPPE